MEIKIEIGDNLKSVMEKAIVYTDADDVESIIKAFDLKGIAESLLEAVIKSK